MGTRRVIVRLARSTPCAYKFDCVHSRWCSAPRLRAVRVIKFRIFTSLTAARGTFGDWIFPRTRGEHCRYTKTLRSLLYSKRTSVTHSYL